MSSEFESPLDREMTEYQDTRAWLRGDKPPARGRTWRRRLRTTLERHGAPGALLALGGTQASFLRVAVGLMIAVSAVPLVTSTVGPLPSVDSTDPVLLFTHQLLAVIHVIYPIAVGLGLIALVCAGLGWALDPHAQ